jgi:hypothetical protein
MKTNAVRFAAGLALFAAGAPFPAFGQFIYPPVFVVPPPAENYASPPPKPPPDKPKPAETSPQAKPAGHYEGRTFVPD